MNLSPLLVFSYIHGTWHKDLSWRDRVLTADVSLGLIPGLLSPSRRNL